MSEQELTQSLATFTLDDESKSRSDVWRSLDPLGFPNYEVCSDGNIRNMSFKPPRALKGSMLPTGYVVVTMSDRYGVQRNKRIHVLVATMFLSNQLDSATVDHIDRDRSNNKVSNLQWATKSQQSLNREPTNSYKGRPLYQFDLNGRGIARWETITIASRSSGLVHQMIRWSCVNHKPHGGFYWRYCDEVDQIDNEEWKPVPHPDYDGLSASSIGRIQTKTGKITAGNLREDGYLYIGLTDINRKKHQVRVHRLVAMAFYGWNDDMLVNHKDGNKTNNRFDNLEFVTNHQNITHALSLGLRDHKSANCHVRAVVQYDLAGNEINRYPSIAEAGRQTNLVPGKIGYALVSSTRSAGGFRWKYAN